MATVAGVIARRQGAAQPLKVEVCAYGSVVHFKNKDNTDAQLLKVALADTTGKIPAIIYNEALFDMVMKCCDKSHVLKIKGYSFSADGTAIIIGSRTEISVIEVNRLSMTDFHRTNAADVLYSPFKTILQVKEECEIKTRVSIMASVEKVNPGHGRFPKKAEISDATGLITLTIWSPHDTQPLSAGDTVVLRDIRVSEYLGQRILDTTMTSLFKTEEASNNNNTLTQLEGEIIGRGKKDSRDTVEFLAKDQDDEVTYFVTAANWPEHETDALPLPVTATILRGVITALSFN